MELRKKELRLTQVEQELNEKDDLINQLETTKLQDTLDLQSITQKAESMEQELIAAREAGNGQTQKISELELRIDAALERETNANEAVEEMQAKMKEIRDQMEVEKAALAASIGNESNQEVANIKKLMANEIS